MANGFSVYYFKSKKLGEIDLLIELNGKALPIKVKSGKAYKTHVALDHVMEASNYTIPESFIFSDANVSRDGKLTYLPIYMSTLVKNEELPDPIVKIDLGVLAT